MYHRTFASWLRRKGVMTLPVAVAALGFAGTARATQPSVVFTPTTTAQLVSDVSTADGEPAGTLSIIQLGPVDYAPSAGLTLNGDIEITGPPTLQSFYGSNGQDPVVDGSQIPTNTPMDLFTVASGAQVLFKGFDMGLGGAFNTSDAAIHVLGGGTAEIDNMGLDGEAGPAVNVSAGGTATMSNSIVGDGQGLGIATASTNTMWLINDTIANDQDGAIQQSAGGKVGAINTMIVNNIQSAGTECSTPLVAGSTHNQVDDSSCGTSGVTVVTAAAENLQGAAFYGGPTESNQPGSGSVAIGAANPTYCADVDQRFYARTASTCDVGSYQTSGDTNNGIGHTPPQTTGPRCTVASVNNSSTPQTMTVNAQDGGVGLGTDAIAYFAPSGSTYPIPTNNGTVSYPTVGSTWFASTFPSPPVPQEADFPSTSPLPVTATKPASDTAVGDTKWSFDATNWLGITTYCK